jgi:hypothetical protein
LDQSPSGKLIGYLSHTCCNWLTIYRVAIGLSLIHLAFDSRHTTVRRATLEAISKLARQYPKMTSRIIRESLRSWLKTQDEQRASKKRVIDEEEVVTSKSRDIGKILVATLVRDAESNVGILEDMAVDFVVLSHHPEIGDDSQVSWISLVQSLGLEPAAIAVDKRAKILKLIWEAAATPPEVSPSLYTNDPACAANLPRILDLLKPRIERSQRSPSFALLSTSRLYSRSLKRILIRQH